MTREELVARLAEVSHRSWMRQAARDNGEVAPSPAVTDHDRERAEDIVAELERLNLVRLEAAEPRRTGAAAGDHGTRSLRCPRSPSR